MFFKWELNFLHQNFNKITNYLSYFLRSLRYQLKLMRKFELDLMIKETSLHGFASLNTILTTGVNLPFLIFWLLVLLVDVYLWSKVKLKQRRLKVQHQTCKSFTSPELFSESLTAQQCKSTERSWYEEQRRVSDIIYKAKYLMVTFQTHPTTLSRLAWHTKNAVERKLPSFNTNQE